jgi:hypothetical protein
MKSFLHNLSRVAMLDLSDALAAGRLKPPYSALRMVGCVPEAVADDVEADLARMDARGMQAAHIAELLQLLAVERAANQQTAGPTAIGLDWTGCSRQRQSRHGRRGEGVVHRRATKRLTVFVHSAPRE